MTHSSNYNNRLVSNVLVLRSSNSSFPPASSRVSRMYYYKSSLSNDYGVDNPAKKLASLFTRITVGTWLHHTFMVFECYDSNYGGTRKFSIDRDRKGLKIKYDERVFESRREYTYDYDCNVSTDVGSIL